MLGISDWNQPSAATAAADKYQLGVGSKIYNTYFLRCGKAGFSQVKVLFWNAVSAHPVCRCIAADFVIHVSHETSLLDRSSRRAPRLEQRTGLWDKRPLRAYYHPFADNALV
jgi:hypothetical protein